MQSRISNKLRFHFDTIHVLVPRSRPQDSRPLGHTLFLHVECTGQQGRLLSTDVFGFLLHVLHKGLSGLGLVQQAMTSENR